VFLALLSVASATSALAQPAEIRLSRTTTMAYLPLMVMQHEKLLEKEALKEGVPDLKVSWLTFTGPSAQIDALLSGNVDIVAVGSTALTTLWARTKGSTVEAKGVSALASMPIVLNTRNPDVKSIRDFTDRDRIAVPSIKVSFQAMLLQMAAAKEWGIENYRKLDHLTVSLGQMDAVSAMLSPRHEVNADFATPPFFYMELEQPGIRPVISLKEILGEKGTIGTAATTSRFYQEKAQLYRIFRSALDQAMAIIASDKTRAVDAYIGATGEGKNLRDMLLRIANDPDAEFTTTPRAMKKYADFMFQTGAIKTKPNSWADIFFPEVANLSGS
jgi:NitT/TauT family transport system substrate-binding protein